jgi:monothiol glutaredoxin
MSRNIAAEIQQTVETNNVVLFMKGNKHMPQCGFSAAAVGMLTELGVSFKDVNVLSDPELRQGIKDFSDWPTVPRTYSWGTFVGGSDIMREMHQSGQLRETLGDAVTV